MAEPVTFTDDEINDLRRFCGYPFEPLIEDPDAPVPFFEAKLASLTNGQIALVRTAYLTPLRSFEQGLIKSASMMGMSQLGPMKTNAEYELRDRTALLAQWQRSLCSFLKLAPGPGLQAPGDSSTGGLTVGRLVL